MITRLSFLLIVFACVSRHSGRAQDHSEKNSLSQEVVFKKIDTIELKMNLFYPLNYEREKKYPVMIFFFGGGWKHGSRDQFEPQARYFASRGIITALADYRTSSKHNTTPFEAVKDAKSAIRYLRENSKKLSVNVEMIAAAGGSAGGHLAAAADLTTLDETSENLTVSSRPNATILFNPVINNGPGNYGYDRVKDDYLRISPYHNIKKGTAPTLILSGTQDKTVPVKVLRSYQEKMLQYGNRCELRLYEGQEHGFYRYHVSKQPANNVNDALTDNKYYYETLNEADAFLVSLGFLEQKNY